MKRKNGDDEGIAMMPDRPDGHQLSSPSEISYSEAVAATNAGPTEVRSIEESASTSLPPAESVDVPDVPNLDHSSANLVSPDEPSDGDIPIVSARPVVPMVEASPVRIDEMPSSRLPEETTSTSSSHHGVKNTRRRLLVIVAAVVIITIIILVIALPRTTSLPTSAADPNSNIAASSMPTSSPTFPYHCYTSTLDILMAQFEPDLPDAYIICPGTRINVGTVANPAANDFGIVGGDYPIVAIRKNVVIQCGLDGKRENNCVLDGGFLQLLLQPFLPFIPDGGVPPNLDFVEETCCGLNVTSDLDNLTVRGLTFSGILDHVGPFRGASLSIAQAGRNMRFEDCLWTNMTATDGVVGVYRNIYMIINNLPLEDRSAHVTFSRCSFQNIVMDVPLILAYTQVVHVENSEFRNIKVSTLARSCEFISSLLADECAGLLYCLQHSACSMSDTCVENVESAGPSIILMTNDTDWDASGQNYLKENVDCEVAIVDGQQDLCEKVFEQSGCPTQ